MASQTASEREWYRRYFGADYLRIYRLEDTGEQLAFLREVTAGLPTGARLLDLPCGHGRHAVPLAAAGYDLTGLDLSEDFLAVARRAADTAGARVRFVRADMRVTPLADSWFDLVLCMFNSLGYFADQAENQRVVDELARVTRAGGRLILDLANPDAVRRQPPWACWDREGVRVFSQYLWDDASRRAVTLRRAEFPDGRLAHYASSVRLYEATEIEAMLAAAGWRVVAARGAYQGGPVSPTSPRRILTCERS